MKSLFQLALAHFSTVLRAWNKPWIRVKKLASSRSIFTPINFHVLFFSLKVQRLVTPIMLQRKRHRLAIKRKRAEKNRQVMFWFHGKNLFYHSFMHMEYFDFTSFFLLFILQAAAEYAKILATRQKEAKEAKELRRKRSASLRESRNSVKST